MQFLLAEHPALLSRDEIAREVGDETATDEALAQYSRLGLVHRLSAARDDFYWPTRTALAAEEAVTAPGPDV
jgi:hypothetical protein